MGMAERHRHVQVVRAGRQGALEDRHDEARIDRVQDVADLVLPAQRGDLLRIRCVDPDGHEPRLPAVPADRLDDPFGPGPVVVGHDHPIEERAARGNRHDGAPDTSGADQQNPHRILREVRASRPNLAEALAEQGLARCSRPR